MPTFYNFRENGLDYSFDDIFVPADWFREGNLWNWGRGIYGRLGNASTTNRSTPVTTSAGGTNWKQVSCGIWHTASIKTDGTLWTWGYGARGLLANGATTGNISTPITTFSGGTNWKQVSAVNEHVAAIKTDGTLWTWGYMYNGRLGNALGTGTRSTPITTFAGGTNWKQVSCGNFHTVAIKTDGTLWGWGRNNSGQLGNNAIGNVLTPITTFAGGSNWKQVSCGNDHTTAIKTDGTLWTWGSSQFLQLGNAQGVSRSTPVTTFAGGNNWKQVSSGGYHTAAIKNDGTLWTWGRNGGGQLGNANTSNVSTPVTTFAGGSNWKQVSVGSANSGAIKTDGTLWTWGYGSYGGLGNGATLGNRSTPVTTFLGGSNWKQVSAGPSGLGALTYQDPGI